MQNLDEIRSIPIVDIYNRYIGGKLIKRGRGLWTNCPWHGSDSEPSLKIYQNQNKWWCYGCNAGGTQIDMVMHALDLTISDAIKRIQRDFTISTVRNIRAERERRTKQDIQESFQRDFNRTYINLCHLNNDLIKMSRDIKIIARYPDVFMHQLKINDLLDQICSKADADQVAAWRKAKKVYPWI
jgi:hypothetical protein